MPKAYKHHIEKNVDDTLAYRVRNVLSPYSNFIEEKKMMGGLAFLLRGKMCCGINKGRLVIRVTGDKYEKMLESGHCRKMDFTGRPLKEFLYVDGDGYTNDKDLKKWIRLGVEYVESKILEKGTKKKK